MVLKEETPDQRLRRFLGKYTPEIAALARKSLRKMRKLVPGAVELVYDNYNALVIGFGATNRPGQAILSFALYPRWMNLFFLRGAALPDPERLLKGGGKVVRFIRIENDSTLDQPGVRKLIGIAVQRSPKPFNVKAKRQIVIRAVMERQRGRRPGA